MMGGENSIPTSGDFCIPADIFAVEYDGTWFLMPALVLLQALFRPLHLLADYLLRPQGLEQVCIPCADNCHDVEWSLLGLRNRQGSLSTLRQPMAWMWSFPSARKMWESVYECGQGGALGLLLPEGEIELVVRGALRGDTLCVTDACFTRVITEEKPYPFASGHTGKITFHENVAFTGRHTAPTPTLDETIRTVHGSWSVTDAEWTRIEPILVGNPIKKKPRLHDLRDLLDGVLVKLGSGIPWQKVEYKVGTWNNAAGAYQQWVKDGRWQRVRATLVESRGS